MANRVLKRSYSSIPQFLGAAVGKVRRGAQMLPVCGVPFVLTVRRQWRHKDLYRNVSSEVRIVCCMTRGA